jgi:mRNA interferase MazF
MPNRGEIWLAKMENGSRGKPRLVLVVQSASLLKVDHPTTLVIPLTGKLTDDAEPLRVRVPAMGKLHRDWDLAIDQICAIDNVHLTGGPVARLDATQLARVDDAIREVLDLVDR